MKTDAAADQATLDAYDRDAESFANDWESQPAPVDLYDAVVKNFVLGGRTADIGCGSGRDTAWLNANGYPTVGYDPSESLLAEARRRHPGSRFRRTSLPDLGGIEKDSFANVLCETVIMHLDATSIPSAVEHLFALLAENGVMILSWRVTEKSDQRDKSGRLYSAFDASLVLGTLSAARVLSNSQSRSSSSGKTVYRVVVQKMTK
jgi:SAM-dependent methyltransferase